MTAGYSLFGNFSAIKQIKATYIEIKIKKSIKTMLEFVVFKIYSPSMLMIGKRKGTTRYVISSELVFKFGNGKVKFLLSMLPTIDNIIRIPSNASNNGKVAKGFS
jgi:hypothetical protein